MERFKQTLYDVMGVARDAGPHDINRAWNRHRSAMRDETRPPDPRGDALMRHAYEVLSDPYRKAAYDDSLRRESPVLRATARAPRRTLAVAVIVAGALSAAAYAVYREQLAPAAAPTLPPVKAVSDIRDSVVRAVGRVQLLDLGGHETPGGVAFAIEEGVMATSCNGLTPAAEPMVLAPPRRWPARITGYDPQGLCRLEVHGGAAFPLRLSGEIPRPGATVYTVDVAPTGEAQLREAKVTRVGGGELPSIQTNLPVTPANAGRPLLDADGRVVAVALAEAAGEGRYVPIPRRWLATEPAPVVSPPRMREAEPAPGPAAPANPGNISPERQQRLQEAFRPPPKVPDDL